MLDVRPSRARRDSGASAVEYGLIIAGVAAALIAVVYLLQGATATAYKSQAAGIEALPPGASPTDTNVTTPPPTGPPAATPPAPDGVATVPGDGQITLVWNPSTGATSYAVYCSGTRHTTTNLTYTCTGLTNGTTYDFSVAGINGNGEGGMSLSVTGTPALQKPSSPTGVTGTAGDGTITVTWNPVSGATGYKVTCTTTNPNTTVTLPSTGSTSLTLNAGSGITNGLTYTCSVVATNAAGDSAPSNTVTLTPAKPVTLSWSFTQTLSPTVAKQDPVTCTYDYSPSVGTAGSNPTMTPVWNSTGSNYTSVKFTASGKGASPQTVTVNCTSTSNKGVVTALGPWTYLIG